MKKIVLQRRYAGQDSYGTFIEQVAIDENKDLYYRRTEGGNYEYGDWQEWEGEKVALSFIFGEMELSKTLIKALKIDMSKAPELKKNKFNLNCY